jgi:hypothetical protein
MSSAVIGALRVVLGADTAAFERGLDGAQRTLNRFNKDMQKLSAKFTSVGQALTVGLTVPMAALGATLMQGAKDAAHASGQVEAALKSMGDGGGRSLAQLKTQADALSASSLFDDDAILTKVTANLLTFGNVAGDVFDRAQQAILDVSARMGGDLQSATLLVGKALNDPAKGLTALRRTGIQFTAEQEKMIKSMVAAGDAAGAQAVMLSELERQFGGAAKAARDADPLAGAMLDLSRAMGVLEVAIAPLAVKLAGFVTGIANALNAMSPAAANFVLIGGLIAAAIGPIIIGVGMLISAVGTIAGLLAGPAVAALVAFLAPFAPVILAVGALVAVFVLFRKQIMPVLQEWGQTVAEVLGPKIAPLIEAAKALFSALAATLVGLFGKGGSLEGPMQFFLDIATRVFNGVVSIVGTQIDVLTDILNALAALFRGDFSAMFGYLKDAAVTMASGIVRAFAAMFPDVVSWVQKTWQGVKTWLVDKFTDVVKAVQQKIAAVTGFFKDMWDAVVGHSYVPDMVDGIRDHFARLDSEMVKPAEAAAAKVEAAFKGLGERLAVTLPTIGQGLTLPKQSDPTMPADAQNARGPNAPANDPGHDGASPNVTAWGGKIMSPEAVERMREQFVSFGHSFTDAVRAGRLKDFFADIANRFVDKLVNDGLNAIFDAIGKTGGGGGGGGWIAAIASVFGGGKAPGFATGGSFTVGGSGGTDSQLMRFWATPGEMVNVSHGDPANDRGGRSTNVFDMRGAVVTQDLLNQMNQIAASGDAQVIGAIAREKQRGDKASRYTVARARR